MAILFLITARAGSKGLPGKNIKPLFGKPLVSFSIEFALRYMNSEDKLCVSTNDPDVIQITRNYGVEVPFVRPEHLASDSASTFDVIIHALDYFNLRGKQFDKVLLLQPTSPYRTEMDFRSVIGAFTPDCDMVVTVKLSKANPYFNLFEENQFGFLNKCKDGGFTRRQDCPPVYAYNGSMYLISVASLRKQALHDFKHVRKVVMPESRSVDIDDMQDWLIAELWYEDYQRCVGK